MPGRPPRRRTVARRLRTGLVVASAIVLGLTGAAWGLYRDVTAGITTTGVVAGDGGNQNILLVGVDSRTDARGDPLPPDVQRELHSGPDTGVLNSDTIILLHVPRSGGAAVAFSIPRDSYVDIPGQGRDKINAAYPVTKARAAQRLVDQGGHDRRTVETRSTEAGRAALVKTVENLTGQTVDHYAEINLLGFSNLTTAIGGVEVCLRAPVDEKLSGARFPAGRQTISGAAALSFVRQRHELPDGDLSRIRRQQVFLAAVADKILSAGILTDPGRLAALIEVAQQSVVIDAGWDLLAFAQRASAVAAGDLAFLTVPTRGTENNAHGNVVLVDRSEVREFVEQRIEERRATAGRGTSTSTSTEQPAAGAGQQQAPEPPAPGDQVVDVGNGSAVGGLAATVADRLRGAGYRLGTVGNAAATPTTVLRYGGPDPRAATTLTGLLGGMPVEADASLPPGAMRVVLGADVDPARVRGQAGAPPAPAGRPGVPPPGQPGAPPAEAAPGVPCID